jgi:pyruvate dehydrogenase E1 component
MSRKKEIAEIYEFEDREWLDSLDFIIKNEPPERVKEILQKLYQKAHRHGISIIHPGNTPYINTIPADEEEPYPGNREIERKIKSIIRWNAMAMVVRANRDYSGIGGHISTYASAATLYEVGFNHFWRGHDNGHTGDIIYYQGHAVPGIYARSFVEGRLTEAHLNHFRREAYSEKGISSYPHPRLMPDYWRYPTVSMGLSPIMAIYHARFIKYMEDRSLKDPVDQKVWAMVGDGEMDEPESMGALTVAAREELDNLIFVVNCNLQRLDGPVRGNGKIIQELEAAYRGAGWNVIKVVWGSEWDELFKKDHDGILLKRLEELVDGESQKYSVEKGDYVREHFFGKYPELLEMVEDFSDDEINHMKRGGHDPVKVYNAYKRAVEHKGSPTVILAQTVKGYGLGEAGEGRNVTHQQKKMNEDELKLFRDRFEIPLTDEKLEKTPFYRPSKDSDEFKYLIERREKLHGFIPKRRIKKDSVKPPEKDIFEEFLDSSGKREVATTMAFVHLLGKLLKDKNIGKLVVPIVPDESRTFGMDALFRQVGIYSHVGQKYEPVDKESLLYYKEARDGAILEEGITEAGSMSSFIAAGTAYANHGVNTIPFFIFYSMFGFQRVGDLIWAAADARARGFLVGGTAGRTTLAGEGLQHQDGHSHLFAFSVPNCMAYDPAFAYELAVIVEEGIKRMYVDQEDIFYYITVMNEKYLMPKMPNKVREGILKGMYKYKSFTGKKSGNKINILGSGAILTEVLKAGEILEKEFNINSDIWCVTSYKCLYEDAIDTDRWNKLHPGKVRKNYIEQLIGKNDVPFVAASDYLKAVPLSVAKWFPGDFTALGTDGFGLSDTRDVLREYFEVDANYIAYMAIQSLFRQNKIEKKALDEALNKLMINKDKSNPRTANI